MGARKAIRRKTGLNREAAQRLKPRLEALLQGMPAADRIGFDPVEFPRRYSQRADIEVVALLAASLAYGRADLFKPKVHALLEQMGSSPSDFLMRLSVKQAAQLLDGFVYRFNVGTDLAVLLWGMGWALRERGSLEQLFVDQLEATRGDWRLSLGGFTAALRGAAPLPALRAAMGPERGLDHLLPRKLGAGASKRLNLFLRWMVRGPDEVDFGLWTRVSPSALLIPLDTHIGRIAKHLRLTRRSDLSWKTAEEITCSLRALDPEDPVRFDFALCHYGMSGLCPAQPRWEQCERCALLESCRVGPGLVARGTHSKNINR